MRFQVGCVPVQIRQSAFLGEGYMSIRRVNYTATATSSLGVRAPSAKQLKFGVEIETGWASQGYFDEFHAALEGKELGDKVISKPDGSITAEFGAEIVTLPFGSNKIVDVVGDVADTLQDYAEYVSVAGCGVHVHTSKGPVSDINRARFMSSVMFDKDSWYKQGIPVPDDRAQRVAELNRFWDLIALREAGSYRYRVSMPSRDLLQTNDHSYACINGQRTPTMELRIFKTCRSPKVLRSYPEVAKSLLDFVVETGPETADSGESMTVDAWFAANIHTFFAAGMFRPFWHSGVRAILDPILVEQGHGPTGRLSANKAAARCQPNDCMQHAQHRQDRGIALQRAGYDWDDIESPFLDENVIYGEAGYEVDRSMHRRRAADTIFGHYWETVTNLQTQVLTHGRNSDDYPYCMIPTRAELVMLNRQYRQNVPRMMWEEGLMPVRQYTSYILENRSKYPNLASRLDLDRFKPFLEGAPTFTVADTFKFDRTAPHDEIGRGCRVARETMGEDSFVCTKYRDKIVYYEDPRYGEQAIAEEQILHTCEGATRLESWGE